MRLYNTISRSKQDFVPLKEGQVSLYVCGPTVYNHIHFGNARTFLSFDLIRRYLEYKGFEVNFVQNITDVDDKIINKANEEGRSFEEVAEEYTKAFIDAMDALKVKPPTSRPKATDHIDEMIELIETLIEKGHAYAVEGDVYFDVRSYPPYGKLSGRKLEDLMSGARVDVDERKKDAFDFALWKSAKPGEPSWDSPWGAGRPGWHIECSVMSDTELGFPFDIHGGGSDLVFPHHENEIAQSEAATGVEFARYWLHGGMLMINSEKMSKSLGNFTTLKQVLAQYPASIIRLFMMQTHYRSPLDFSDSRLAETAQTQERILTFIENVDWAESSEGAENTELEGVEGTGLEGAESEGPEGKSDSSREDAADALLEKVRESRKKFEAEMDDDFNSAGAIGPLFELIREGNALLASRTKGDQKSLEALVAARELIIELFAVLGVDFRELTQAEEYPQGFVTLASELLGFEGDSPAEALDALLDMRAQARADKEWAKADAVRDGFAAMGYVIEDTANGARVKAK